MLEEMVVNDLRGPSKPDEEIDERNVHDRYLVGTLAPRRHSPVPEKGTPASPVEADQDADGDLPPNDDLALGGDEGGSASGDDGPVELSAPQSKAIFPSSLGMSFSVDLEAKELQVTASWGRYERQPSEYLINEKSGSPKLVWKREPCGGSPLHIPLAQSHVGPLDADPSWPGVVIKGVIRKRKHHWSVTLFLVNEQEEPDQLKDTAWVFQPELAVEAPEGTAIFDKRTTVVDLSNTDPTIKAENEMLSMLYRRHVEFAVGHGVGVHVDTLPGNPNRAVRIATKVIPSYEVPKTTPPMPEDAAINPAFTKLDGLERDMAKLAETPQAKLREKIEPLVIAYREWIELEQARIGNPDEGLADYRKAALLAIDRCKATLRRIEEGLDLLEADAQAAEAFHFMNRAMWLQRTRSIFSENIRRGKEVDYNDVDISANRSWYPFQLAFILLNLPGVTKLDHPERSDSSDALADLLWFPTGGGKTEAYLGLTAYTLGLRRLQGKIEGRSGENGVSVLMRYTLRLLTLQQFQRATALICACEQIRREALGRNDDRWGKTPFRIGLWVGARSTPNKTEESDQSIKTAHGSKPQIGSIGGIGTPHQLTNCPWCGTKIDPGKGHIQVDRFKQGRGRTLIYCGDKFGQCMFSKRQSPGEGLPVVVVDEEIYRLLPSLLITTVDKFAQMPWNGAVQMLFGQVDGFCERHGFRSPELEDSNSHPQSKTGLPSARTIPHGPLRPPDLIIQDELHLISGPLGTLVGLYETAIDKLCSWEVGGKTVRPKVVASTATIRRASDQVHALFRRKINIFPPTGLDVRDNFFSIQRPSNEDNPGRKYIGICAPGKRLKSALIRTYVAVLSAGQVLFEKFGEAADPWMTLVGYFNSLRELGGMKRLVDDDVRTRLGKMAQRGLAKRIIYSPDSVKELTSRLGSTAIPETLDLLERIFNPVELENRRKKAEKGDDRGYTPRPLDVMLATNMISVGVDVPRLGLMAVAGQPKTTAEYIQASSRIGRKHPGLVCTVYNWARPRDLSHYETFEQYHATFYKHVEALSVTPFSPGALSRGLAALLVSLVRLPGMEFNPNETAMLLATQAGHAYVQDAIKIIEARANEVANREVADFVREELKHKVDLWQARAQRMSGGSRLGYKTKKDGQTIGLLTKPSIEAWDEFTCLNSLREVEPTANLILDDRNMDDDRDFVQATEITPTDGGPTA